MKKFSIVLLIAATCLLTLTACGSRSAWAKERVEERIEEVMSERYGVEFSVQRIEYNVSYNRYEADVITPELEEGKSVYVVYESKNKIYDDYYVTCYCLELANKFEEVLDLQGEHFVYARPMLELKAPTFEDLTYEESLEQEDITSDDMIIVLSYLPGKEDPKEVVDAVIRAMEAMPEEDLGVRICLVNPDKLENVKYTVSHYCILDKYYESLDYYQERVGTIQKEASVITTTTEDLEAIMEAF